MSPVLKFLFPGKAYKQKKINEQEKKSIFKIHTETQIFYGNLNFHWLHKSVDFFSHQANHKICLSGESSFL